MSNGKEVNKLGVNKRNSNQVNQRNQSNHDSDKDAISAKDEVSRKAGEDDMKRLAGIIKKLLNKQTLLNKPKHNCLC